MIARREWNRRYTPVGGRNGGLSLILAILLLLFATQPGSAVAQFAGPSASLTSQVNTPLVPTTDLSILYPAAPDVKLDQGDLLTIKVYGSNDYGPVVRVALDGSIRLPLIGSVQVRGLTIHEAERLIADRLIAAGMYKDPQVNIQLTESPNDLVTLSGEMHGVFPLIGSKRLFDVLSLGGGMPITASHVVTINRPGVDVPIIVDLGNDPAHSERADVPVFPHDTIVVARVGAVYMLGAFKTQGAILLQKDTPMTLLQALSVGGGANFEGKYKDLRIIRTTGVTRSVVRVDVRKVMYGHAPDPLLQPDDVIFLPTDVMKAMIQQGGIGTALGIISILLYTFHP